MAVDIFLKIEGIKGESGDHKHKEEIELVSWSWGVSQSGGSSYGGGAGAGKANFQDIQFTHRVDKATPRLFQACATGEHIKSAVLTVRKAGKEAQEYYTCKLNDLFVTGVHGGGSGHDEVPHENVTLNFAKVEFEYKPQKPDGTLDSGVKFGYDLKANKQT